MPPIEFFFGKNSNKILIYPLLSFIVKHLKKIVRANIRRISEKIYPCKNFTKIDLH